MGRFNASWGETPDNHILTAPFTMSTAPERLGIRRKLTAEELRAQALVALKAWQEALESEQSEQQTLETLVTKLSADITGKKDKEALDQRIRTEFLKLMGSKAETEAPKESPG